MKAEIASGLAVAYAARRLIRQSLSTLPRLFLAVCAKDACRCRSSATIEVMGEDDDVVAKHSPASTHNDASGVFLAPVVQAGSITGDVIVNAGTSTKRRRWGRGKSPGRSGLSDIDAWTEDLAQGVQTLWRQEEDHRRVHDPVALPVRWHPAADLADHWANIRRLPAGVSAEPLALAGRIEQLGEIYRSIPSGRLVLLGQAGAGKTVLVSRLALDLLQTRRPGQPVPVIVSAGSWNPATTPLHVWLAEQLTRDHPGLAAPVQKGGPTRAAALIEASRIVPILDGLDEIDAGLHQAALQQLNTTPDTPLVITSRVEQYTTAVSNVDVLTAAAVVELDDLTVDDLANYLPRTAAGHRTGIWDPVLEQMRAQPHPPGPATLRRVLTNPLMVFLVRTIYSDTPGHNPMQLLDTHRFPTTSALQNHLLSAFIPAVYQADQPDRTRRRWPADRAHHYLTYLANHLQKAGTPDLAWWQLRDTIPRWLRTLIFAGVDGLVAGLAIGPAIGLTAALASGLTVALTIGLTKKLQIRRLRGKRGHLSDKLTLVVGLAVCLTVGLAVWLKNEPGLRGGEGLFFGVLAGMTAMILAELYSKITIAFAVGLAVCLTVGLGLGVAEGLLFGLVAALAAGFIGRRGVGPRPTRTRFQIRGRARFVADRLGIGIMAGGVVGIIAGIMIGIADGIPDGLVFGFAFGLSAGAPVGLTAAVAFGFEAPVNGADVVSAAESLAWDRRNTIRKMLVVGFLAWFMIWFWLPSVFALKDGLVFGLKGGLVSGLTLAVVAGFVSVRATSAWIYWLVLVRGWLPLTGRLPWRVQAFLTDAYQRGVLRQTGTVYQFRHARLQHHLIADTPAADG